MSSWPVFCKESSTLPKNESFKRSVDFGLFKDPKGEMNPCDLSQEQDNPLAFCVAFVQVKCSKWGLLLPASWTVVVRSCFEWGFLVAVRNGASWKKVLPSCAFKGKIFRVWILQKSRVLSTVDIVENFTWWCLGFIYCFWRAIRHSILHAHNANHMQELQSQALKSLQTPERRPRVQLQIAQPSPSSALRYRL